MGVKDDGTLLGLSVTDELLRQLADMRTDGNILPPPSMTVEKRSLSGGDIAVVTVLPSDSPPVRFDGRVHIRTGTRRDTANAQDELILSEKRRHGEIPFDIHPIPTATLNDLNLTQFTYEYLPQAFAREVLEANQRSIEQQLAGTKMIADAVESMPTVLGMLVLGKRTLDYLPGAYIQFLRFDGSDPTDPIADEAGDQRHNCGHAWPAGGQAPNA